MGCPASRHSARGFWRRRLAARRPRAERQASSGEAPSSLSRIASGRTVMPPDRLDCRRSHDRRRRLRQAASVGYRGVLVAVTGSTGRRCSSRSGHLRRSAQRLQRWKRPGVVTRAMAGWPLSAFGSDHSRRGCSSRSPRLPAMEACQRHRRGRRMPPAAGVRPGAVGCRGMGPSQRIRVVLRTERRRPRGCRLRRRARGAAVDEPSERVQPQLAVQQQEPVALAARRLAVSCRCSNLLVRQVRRTCLPPSTPVS